MNNIKIAFLVIALMLCMQNIAAQELNCNITVNTDKVESTNKQVFSTFESSLKDFMNGQQWTQMNYTNDEKIDCNISLIVNSYVDDVMSCVLQIQASRPVHSSSYTTTLFNFRDQNFHFTYREFDPIEVNSNTYESNLSALLAYYAYIIIGLDMDSFGKMGGDEMFTAAEQIVSLSQNRSNELESKGWKAFENDRNRYALISQLRDDRFTPFREYYYTYHRQALDNMFANVGNARKKIADGLPIIRELNRMQPSAILLVAFLDAKKDELINIFAKHASEAERKAVYEILTDIDPTSTDDYEKIIE